MARATLTTVQRIVYDNLGITNQGSGYGNLQTNERYLSGYINDKIAEADITIVKLLFKNKHDTLLSEIYTTANLADEDPISQNWGIVKVTHLISGAPVEMVEVDFDVMTRLKEVGIYTRTGNEGYYCVNHGSLMLESDGNGTITYIDFTHPTTLSTLKCPSGFESVVANLASALLLMKRQDKPEQSSFYYGLYKDFMQEYLLPDQNIPEIVNNND